MTPLDYFRTFAPEFECNSNSMVSRWLTIAEAQIDVSCLDDERAAMAQALFAAHLMSITLRSALGGSVNAGPVTREKEGDLERTYGTLKGSDTYLGQTTYGQQYLDITKACHGSAIMTRVAL